MPRSLGICDPSGVETISQPWPLLLRVEKNSNLDGGKFGGENVDFSAFKQLGDPLDMSIMNIAVNGEGSPEL
jgi:hypothetical protein